MSYASDYVVADVLIIAVYLESDLSPEEEGYCSALFLSYDCALADERSVRRDPRLQPYPINITAAILSNAYKTDEISR
jgi:hypothetical protein